MKTYVVYEVWTSARVVKANSKTEAYRKGEPKPRATGSLSLCNWHVKRVKDKR